MNSLHHNSRNLASDSGLTLVVALGVLLVSSLLMTAAFVAAGGDIHLTQADTSAKKAYYAAQAGIQDYEYHLTQDGNYLSYCTTPNPSNPALNQLSSEATGKEMTGSELLKHSAEVPALHSGETTGERYAIQLLPAESSEEKKCNTSNVVGTMIEQKPGGAAGTFRVQSTGFAEGKKRTIVATFKNLNFVSYVWYTVYETADSVVYGKNGPNCAHFYLERPGCEAQNNYFITGESVNGPLHTADHGGVCGRPTLGRNENDRIEFGNGNNKEAKLGYSKESCSEEANPEVKGKLVPPKETLSVEPPPGDEELAHVVEPAYLFKGKTEIVLKGSSMTIIEHKGPHTAQEEKEGIKENVRPGVEFPSNGVIYVEGVCSTLYSPYGPGPGYAEDANCGNVYVSGEYTTPLTIAAQNDVIINGNITTPGWNEGEGKPTTNAMLGLIANNFVRVYHPLLGTREPRFTGCKPSAENDKAHDLPNPTIYAAILAVKHSFIVDNFDCGEPKLGTLTLYGAVAGLFSNGMTGVFNGSHTLLHGYPLNLKYDNRLEVAEPPHFLNPIEAAWYVQRETLASSP